MKNNLIGQITVAVLAVVGTVWYLFVYQPNQQALARDNIMRKKLGTCLDSIHEAYLGNWNKFCKDFGINHKNDGCLLPSSKYERLEEWKRDEVAGCYKKFPVK